MIPDILFAEPKKFILVEIPYCVNNENTVKRLLGKLSTTNLMLQLNGLLRKSEVCFG